MIITLGNQKGGSGKSTLTLLYANYLAIHKKIENVNVLDLDFQATTYSKFQKSQNLEMEQLYPVEKFSLEEYIKISSALKSAESAIYIIDLPGKLDDNNLIQVILDTDVFIVPFDYEEGNFESTVTFTLTVNQINPKAKILFVPNRIKTTVKYNNTIEEELSEYGMVVPAIKDLIAFQRITSKHLSKEHIANIEEAFETINNNIGI